MLKILRYLDFLSLTYLLYSEALDDLGLTRYCCRRMILTHVDLIEKLLKYVPSANKAATAKQMRKAARQPNLIASWSEANGHV